MNKRFTAAGLRRSTQPIRLHDLTILPPQPTMWEIAVAAETVQRMDGFPPELLVETKNASPYISLILWNLAYDREWEGDREPEWAARLPTAMQRYLRITTAIRNEHDEDVVSILPAVPYAGFGYLVHEDGLSHRTMSTFHVWRLQGIRQLGFLHDPLVTDVGMKGLASRFPHTRCEHVLNVAAHITLMGVNNGLSASDLAHARVAALTHDTLTPAGGDTTKLVDYAAFDEDANYPELLAKIDWTDLRETYALDGTRLKDIILNRGTIGQLLDVADKAAYVGCDAQIYVHRLFGAQEPPEYAAMREFLEQHPDVCAIWDTVRIAKDGTVWLDDPERLEDFLRLRIMLSRWLYFHPGARFVEFVIASTVCRYLYETGIITRDWLLTKVDQDLDEFMGEFLGLELDFATSDRLGEPRVETFATEAEARAREVELIRAGVPLTMVENLTGKIKPATHFRVRDGKKYLPFRTVYEREGKELAALATIPDPFRVYHLSDPQISAKAMDVLLAYRRRTLKL